MSIKIMKVSLISIIVLVSINVSAQYYNGSFTISSMFNIKNTYLDHSNRTVGSFIGDFNGDGSSDILRWWDDYRSNQLYLSNRNGSFSISSNFNIKNTYLDHSNGTVGSFIGDFNGDGLTDILRWWDDYHSNQLYLSNGNGSFSISSNFNIKYTSLSHSDGTVGSFIGDFNGDGLTDILRWWDDIDRNQLFLSNGDGSFTVSSYFNIKNTYLDHSNGTVGSFIGDFNGDGLTDILRWWDNYRSNQLYLSNGNGSFSISSNFNIKNTYLDHSNGTVGSFIGDFNGDGSSDILRWWDSYRNNQLYLSNGNGSFFIPSNFNIKYTFLDHSNGTVGSFIGDFNGDGSSDVLRWWDDIDRNQLFLGPSY